MLGNRKLKLEPVTEPFTINVVSPLLSLMIDNISVFQRRGVAISVIYLLSLSLVGSISYSVL